LNLNLIPILLASARARRMPTASLLPDTDIPALLCWRLRHVRHYSAFNLGHRNVLMIAPPGNPHLEDDVPSRNRPDSGPLKGTRMTKTDHSMAREILEAHLKAASSSHRFSDSIRIQQVADPLDMTQEAAQRDVAVQILDRESALARRIRSAIGRTADGSYGLCLDCEEEIAPKRLKAIPWAELCVGCQEKAEDSSRQGGRASSPENWAEAA
jgi:DnaK suppressor protein